QLPGPLFHPPLLWDTIYPQQDIYLLRLPDDLPGGLYWPHVGLYDFDTLDRLPVRLETGTEILDHVTLPPIKVVSARAPDPTQPLQAQFGEWGELLGYDLVAPADPLRPGEQFTVRLYYRSRTAAPGDFTRFLQLYNETAGVAAQTDSPPRQGGNPTSSWMAGEVIVDEATLTIAADAAPGEYTLYLGFYPSPTPAERVPLYSANGERLQHDWLPLATLRLDAP
ncbi:MAG TPA: hypothetical protein VNK95_02930, partial [Caldilineaceae bacterium]|nr:hypothetical protein [Caldilineaceae bacterium]